MFTAKTFLKFRWIFPGIYLAMLLVLLVGMVSGAGHTPHSLDVLSYPITAPCYLLELLKLDSWIPQTLFDSIICTLVGFLAYGFIGYLLDVALLKLRRAS